VKLRNNILGRRGDIRGDCLRLKSRLKEVNGSVLIVFVCVVKDNGSLTMDDEDIEVLFTIYTLYKRQGSLSSLKVL